MTRTLQADIQQAAAFQHELFPRASQLMALASHHGLDIATRYQGCDTLAGDYWTLRDIDAQHVALCMVDFTGHGVMAALNTAQIHTLLNGEVDLLHPESMAMLLNHHLTRMLAAGNFATYVYAVLNTKTGHMTYTAGGMPPMVIRHASGKMTSLLTNGVPLALSHDLITETRTAKLEKGDTLFIYSDALTDSPHIHGVRWGTEGLVNAIRGLSFDESQTVNQQITGLLDTFYETVQLPVPDDLTLVALRRV